MKLNLENKSIHIIASSTNKFCLHYLQRPDAGEDHQAAIDIVYLSIKMS